MRAIKSGLFFLTRAGSGNHKLEFIACKGKSVNKSKYVKPGVTSFTDFIPVV